MAADPGRQLALVYVACQMAALTVCVFRPGRYAECSPSRPAVGGGEPGRPQFIYQAAVGDADIALILAEKEQARVVARLAPALEQADEVAAASIARLCAAIGGFLGSIAGADEGAVAALPHEQLDRIANLQARNEVLRSLYENVQQFAHGRVTPASGPAASWPIR